MLLLASIAAALVGAADGAAVRAQSPKLFGTVGPGATIVLRDAQGNNVRNVDPGTYDIEVRDLSDEHNFHLQGPGGVNRETPVEGTATETWTVTLVQGTYTYVCDPHQSTMRGSFTVGDPPTTTTPKPVTQKTKLVLTSGPGPTITLQTGGGKTVKSMRLGTYAVTVRDRATNHNARIAAPGFKKATTVPFVGTQTWKVKLAKVGTLKFLCDPHSLVGMRGSAKIVP